MNVKGLLRRAADWLALERDVAVMVVAVLLITAGTQLWSKYMPKYLEYLGASVAVIALYGFLEQLLGAVYQYPGGALADRLGAKNALVLFALISIAGYALCIFAENWVVLLLAVPLILVWDSMSSPAIFTLIGDALGKRKRAMGFSVQSILKRIPIVVAPPIGGYLIETLGFKGGMRLGFAASIVAAAAAALLQRKFYTPRERKSSAKAGASRLWRVMDPRLKRLLVSDILARTASYMVKVFIVLYVIDVLGASPLTYGLLVSLQMTTSILTYLPAAKLADIYGRRPFVAATFTFFGLFPLAFALITTPALLPVPFIIAGLREIGEPARKALIVDLAGEEYRGRIIGLYYLLRESITMAAPLIGGALWLLGPRTPFYTAGLIGLASAAFFIHSTREK